MRVVFIDAGCSREEYLKAFAAVTGAYCLKRRLILLDGMCGGIKDAFGHALGRNPFKEEMRYFSLTGFDYLMQKYRLGSMTFGEVILSCDAVIKDRLYILPSSGEKIRGDETKCLIKISDMANENGYDTFTALGQNIDADVMKNSDLIVFCLGSSKLGIEDIFVSYVDYIEPSKVFYLVCGKNGVCNKTNIGRKYSLKASHITDIEFGERFERLYKKGRAEGMIRPGIWVKRPENIIYAKKLKKAARMIEEAAAYG